MTDTGNAKRDKLLREFNSLETKNREYYEKWRNAFSGPRNANSAGTPKEDSEDSEECGENYGLM